MPFGHHVARVNFYKPKIELAYVRQILHHSNASKQKHDSLHKLPQKVNGLQLQKYFQQKKEKFNKFSSPILQHLHLHLVINVNYAIFMF